ncbi:MAG: hypothetical protein QOH92_947 [Chloroflexota bacterium]|jgi:uncharacterized repeat protein (TIGR01451 family)|nr:hypothetical protein [Chloroflexota bacterium]
MNCRKRLSTVAASLLLLSPIALTACGPGEASKLVVTQSTDAPSGSDHKSHLAPGVFIGITLSIRNTGAGAARGVTVEDVLPGGFRYYELTTLGGNAIRTATSDPAAQGNPVWGTFTIPAGNGNTVSALILSFRVQAAVKPGDYQNKVKINTSLASDVAQGDPVGLVVEPRPALTVAAAAATAQVTTGGMATYVVSVSNVGSAVAKSVVVSVSLAPGFLYTTTTGYEGNSVRVSAVDPPGNSLLPVWSSWDIPGAVNGAAGLLRLTFQARVLAAVVPGLYNLTVAVTSAKDVPPQTIGNTAPVAVGKGTTIPITMTVAPTAPYAAQNGTVTYVLTVENDSTDAAKGVTVTDTLPLGFAFQSTNSIVINGQNAGSRLQPAAGSATPQWGPFTLPGGGFNGSTLVITFTAKVGGAPLGPHANVVSGNSSNAQITGASDQAPVIVTAS